uniref:Transketolase-like pyrimidine-binding domain-containing protein n=1 Tax=Glossina brevipalpis TaxID=37001 RepID=A0A1A9WEJ4_9MUSC
MSYHKPEAKTIQELKDIAQRLRIHSITSTQASKSGRTKFGVAIGAACRDRTIAFASTFATFFTRAFDQIRMGAISQTNVNFVGSHCGVSIGEDGPSQMGLEDIAMFRTIPGSTVFYPSDAVSCERAVELAANTKGVCFIRTSRPNTAVIYENNETFAIGKAHIVKKSAKDQVLLIGACVTLYECLQAAKELEKIGIQARVLDPFTVKPLDSNLIVENGRACGGHIVVVEDHYQQGGLGEAVLSVLSDKQIMSVLFFNTMRLNLKSPRDPSSDRFVLSKGHAAPILYAAWAEAGLFPVEDLLNLRKIDSDLEGHPTPRLNFIDVGTGSLGQGVAVAAGMAYVGKNFDKSDYRTYVLVGDGESAEGSIWESLHFAGYYKLDNLCVIFDVNRLGQSEPTSLQHRMDIYRQRLEAFGFNALVVDGHDVDELCKAFYESTITKTKPTAIIAKTFKGKYFPNIEDLEGWHGKPLGDKAESVIKHLQGLIVNVEGHNLSIKSPINMQPAPQIDITDIKLSTPPTYKLGDQNMFCTCFRCRQGGLGEAVLSVLADKRGFIVKHLFIPTVPRSGPSHTLLDRYVRKFTLDSDPDLGSF